MSKLFDVTPPRPADEIAALLAPLEQRTKRQATRLGGIFVVLLALIWILLMATPSPTNPDNPYEGVEIATGLLLFAGIAPFIAIRFIMLRDVRTARAMLSEGHAYTAIVANLKRFPYGGLNIIDLQWGSDTAKSVGIFEIIDYDQPLEIGQQFEVFAVDGERQAVALLGDNGLVVGRVR